MHIRTCLTPGLTLLLLVGCNRAPEGLGVTLTPQAPSTLDPLVATLSPQATDPNANDAVAYRYTWYVDDSRMDALTTETVSSAETRKGQTWRVSVTAWDGKLSSAAVQAEVTVQNTPPEAQVIVQPEAPLTMDAIKSEVDTADIDHDTVTVRYQWSLNGSVTSLTNDTLPANRTRKGEVWELRVTPNDGDDDGSPSTATFTIGNTPPSITKATIEPSSPTRASTLTCRGQGWQDVDEDEAGYTVQWYVNGTPVSPNAELSGATLKRTDEVICELTPHDGDDPGDSVRSVPVIVRNAPPRLSSVTIGPKDPKATDIITSTIEGAEDPDGDEVSYQYSWRINGRQVSSADTLNGSRFVRGDQIVLQVTPDDGYDQGEAVISNKVVAANNIPEITGLTLPSEIFTDTVFTIVALTKDHDGDDIDLKVEWYVNSKKVTETSDTLDGKIWFDRNDTVYGVVTPDDGADEGASVTTATFTVKNSVPTPVELSIDPSPAEDADDLTCDIDKVSVDADKDKITYGFVWTVDGKTFGGATTTTYTSDTILAADTKEGQRWTCEVTPTDGRDDGFSTASSVSIGSFEISKVGSPTSHRTESFTYGNWGMDPKSKFGGRVWVLPSYNNGKSVAEYSSFSDFKSGKKRRTVSLTYGYEGTGHTINNGILYYMQFNTNTMVRYDLATGKTTHRVALPGAVYHNKAHYQWGGYSDIDFAYDETGLYVIYATTTRGNIVISRLNPDTMKVLKTWKTTRSKTAGNSFMVSGMLYVTKSYNARSTTIDYIYDTNASKGKSAAITFANTYGYNSMIDYNYGDEKLYSWDNRNLVTYPLTFK